MADELFGGERPHLVTSAIEHQAVRRTARWLAAKGYAELSVIAPSADGVLDAAAIIGAIRPGRTALVSIQAAGAGHRCGRRGCAGHLTGRASPRGHTTVR